MAANQILMTSITPEDLAEIIESRLRKIIAEQPVSPTAKTQEVDELLNIAQVAQFLTLTKPTIYTLVSRGKIPSMKQGKRLYFSKADLIRWVKEGKRTTPEQDAAEVDEFLSSRKKRG
jgi:excisionase family DNA binding protein